MSSSVFCWKVAVVMLGGYAAAGAALVMHTCVHALGYHTFLEA